MQRRASSGPTAQPSVSTDSDGLGQRLAAGCDPQLLEELYDAHGPLCYQLAHRIIADPHLASDVVQEVFLAVWNRHAVFDPSRGSVKVWLLQVTHHKAVDAVRRHERHRSRAAGPDMLIWMAAGDDVEEAVSAREQLTSVLAALADLSVAQREAIELAYFGGHTQAEIAGLTDTPLGTIKTRTLAALRRLRKNVDLLAISDAEGWTGTTSDIAAAP